VYFILISVILLPLQSCQNRKQDSVETKKQDYYAETYAEVYLSIGNIYDNDKALEYYKKAIELKPDYAMAYNNIGAIYESKQDYDKALEYYNKAIELEPDVIAYTNIGAIYDRKQDYDKAIEYYNKAIKLKPDYATYNNIGAVYAKKQDYDKAIEHYKKATELDSNFTIAYQNIELAYKAKECKQAQQNTEATINTSRSKEDVMQVVDACMYNLKRIYNNYLKKKTGFSGKIMLEFTIAPNGDIISISIMSSTTNYPEFDEAIKNTVDKWKWKPIKGDNTTHIIPFNFAE